MDVRVPLRLAPMNGPNNSVEFLKVLSTALLCDVHTLHGEVFTKSALDRSLGILTSRLAEEGVGFLTETLPRLGKRLDQSLANGTQFSLEGLRLTPKEVGATLPKFMGELFELVFSPVGDLLPTPPVKVVRSLRQVLYAFYKLELPYAPALEQAVVEKFEKTDNDLIAWNQTLARVGKYFGNQHDYIGELVISMQKRLHALHGTLRETEAHLESLETERSLTWDDSMSHMFCVMLDDRIRYANDECIELKQQINTLLGNIRWVRVLRRARALLFRVFRGFDPKSITPSHGPGAVSTRERLHEKWRWTDIPDRLAHTFPIDEYFFVNMDHVCDRLNTLLRIGDREHPARVVLVPKDSRGPRLISCEPLSNQWIQQGLGRAVVERVETCALTKHEVHFTDQTPNRIAALHGSATGNYVTLDLEEASDRVSLELVRLLFPEPLLEALLAARSQETTLPCGRIVKLQKYAPMGSALCFPVLALTIWSILRAGLTDGPVSSNKSKDKHDEVCLVYGDDVIVTAAKAADAIAILESFGLKVNRDKSCTGGGLFRESCGMDAFRGESVTPVRFRTAWTSHPRPSPYQSYVAYANALYRGGYHNTYDAIVERLYQVYGPLADESWRLPVPSVVDCPEAYRSHKVRTNVDLQKIEHRVLEVRPRRIRKEIDGWMMLLRYFTSKVERPMPWSASFKQDAIAKVDPTFIGPPEDPSKEALQMRRSGQVFNPLRIDPPFSASSYTKRQDEVLSWCWR